LTDYHKTDNPKTDIHFTNNHLVDNHKTDHHKIVGLEPLFGLDEKYLNISIRSELHENKSRCSCLHSIESFDDIWMSWFKHHFHFLF
jgi:hypothetical protein